MACATLFAVDPARAFARRALLGLLLLPLVACGFHPLYGEQEQAIVEPELATIYVAPIPERIGQQLELMLRASLNPDGIDVKRRYTLAVVLTTSRVDLGIQRDASSTRGRIDTYVTFRLLASDTGKAVYNSRAQSSADFNILTDAYAAEVAEEDARTRTARELAVEIRTRLALYLRELPKTAQSAR